jgi:hypothetical protein
VCSLINSGLPAVLVRGIEELNEFLLYSRPEEYENRVNELLKCLFAILSVYNTYPEIMMVSM